MFKKLCCSLLLLTLSNSLLYAIKSDFNGDGNVDILVHNSNNNRVSAWLNTASGTSNKYLKSLSSDVMIIGTGDINGDNKTDVIIQNHTNQRINAWLTTENESNTKYLKTLSSNVKIIFIADINGDTQDDIIVQNIENRRVNAWISTAEQSTNHYLKTLESHIEIIDIADINGDGKKDIIVKNNNNQRVNAWISTAGQSITQYLKTLSLEVEIEGIADINGDGKDDIIVKNHNNGRVNAWLSTEGQSSTQYLKTLSNDLTIVDQGDINGDGKDDIIVRNNNNGRINAWLSTESQSTTRYLKTLSSELEIIGVGDINGDGNDDILLQNSNNNRVNAWLNNTQTTSTKYLKTLSYGINLVIFNKKQEPISRAEAIKFLRQGSLAFKEDDIDLVMNKGYEAWINTQQELLSDLDSNVDTKYGYFESLLRLLNQLDPTNYPTSIITDPFNNLEEVGDGDRFKLFSRNIWWHKALDNEDQLRQKVTYALSQILVTSYLSPAGSRLQLRGESLAVYYDILQKHAFGNYKDLLKEVSMSSTMGYYLTYIGNQKTNEEKGTAPDENYAREIMQLFTIGLKELTIDGTSKLDNKGNPIPTYSQEDVVELSKVFTGWDFQDAQNDTKYGSTGQNNNSYMSPLEFTEEYHEFGTKTVLGQTIPAGLEGEADIDKAIEILFSNANVAPYISKHLIMRLTSSNPSPSYIARVATVFNNNGSGIKGDLKAVVKAILLDDEARGISNIEHFGKVDELLCVSTQFLKAFNAQPMSYWEFTKNGQTEMINKYWLLTEKAFGQAALSAESVFNFYSPDFVPSDSSFNENNLVSPELQIQNLPTLMGFSNFVEDILHKVPEDAIGKTQNNKELIYLDLTQEYNVLEKSLDGDTNGDFMNILDENKTSIAIATLVNHLDERLLGSTMPDDFKLELNNSLNSISKNKNKIAKAKFIVTSAIRNIVTSPLYIVLK
ncbi:MAG: FIG01201902: hypothetical protein [uncultured Sulfurovum sp.]|uniref:VCBS repeat-containing protein n=1 Tax=uncultured Sulfurovum sp. TaxID=269237 RepID=A0A6S6SZM2_9BACT|nr:MAG: FIG01201902: hypothetical protein [uncultured Sulfurovum sp.]